MKIGFRLVGVPLFGGLRQSSSRSRARALTGMALVLGFAFAGLAATPNDPRFNAQWHLKKINTPAAWETTTGSKEVVVAVLDTGVNYNDPDLAPNMWRNPGETGVDENGKDKATNGMDDDGNGYADDVYGINAWDNNGDPMDYGFTRGALTIPYTHGTACAGVIGAVGNNALGTVGVNWNVSMMAVRSFPVDFDRDWNNPKVTSACIRAFEYVLEMKRRGVNIAAVSLSGGVPSFSHRLYETVNACGREGILTVVLAGNNGLNNDQIGGYLSALNFQHVIVVGATLQDDALGSVSNYGRSTVHLGAPGLDIVTTDYDDFNATSSATPQVSGAIALLKSVRPKATVDELKAVILGSVDQPLSLNGRLVSNGRLNVAKALARLTNNAAPTIVVTALPVSPRTRTNHPIRITFSRAMDRASVEAALRFNPPISGQFAWENEDRTVTLAPGGPLLRTNYSATIARTARDARGDTLDGNYNGLLQDSTADDFKWTFGFGVPNDDFAEAATIVGMAGSHRATTRNASPEVDEPDHAQSRLSSPSVWYRWIAPGDGWQTFEATAASYDTLFAIYTGDALTNLFEVYANDNNGPRLQSRASFAAVAGTTYFIALAAKASEANKLLIDESRMGSFTLAWYPTPPPSFASTQFTPAEGSPGATITLYGTNFTGATEVLFNGVSGTLTNTLPSYADLRIVARVPNGAASGPITVVTPRGSVTSASSFTVVRPQLSIRATAPKIVEITWTDGTAQFVLEESETMLGDSWNPVTQTPSLENGLFRVTLPVSQGRRFFRVRQE